MTKNGKFSQELIDPFIPTGGNFIVRAEHFKRYKFAQKYLQKNRQASKVVYDVACGDGYGSSLLSVSSGQVIGFDRSKEYLKEAYKSNLSFNDVFLHNDLDTGDFAEYIRSKSLPYPTCIVCFETLEHVSDPLKLMESFNKLLPQKGILLISIPNSKFEPKRKESPSNPYHKHLFTKDQILELVASAGFIPVKVLGQPLSNILLHHFKGLTKWIDRKSLSSQEAFEMYANLIAEPVPILIDQTYSYLVVAEKA